MVVESILAYDRNFCAFRGIMFPSFVPPLHFIFFPSTPSRYYFKKHDNQWVSGFRDITIQISNKPTPGSARHFYTKSYSCIRKEEHFPVPLLVIISTRRVNS